MGEGKSSGKNVVFESWLWGCLAKLEVSEVLRAVSHLGGCRAVYARVLYSVSLSQGSLRACTQFAMMASSAESYQAMLPFPQGNRWSFIDEARCWQRKQDFCL